MSGSNPTRQDASKVAMGSTGSSDRTVTNHDGDVTTFAAGLAVKDNAGALSLTTGSYLGVSLGRAISEPKKVSICRAGNRVPVQLTDEGVKASLVVGDLTFTAKDSGAAGDDITIALVDGGTNGSETVTVVDKAVTVHMEDGVSTATHIKAAIDASTAAQALLTVAISGTAGAAQDAAAADNLASGADSYPYVVKGAVVHLSATTGKAISTGGTTSGAVYLDGPFTGVKVDGTTVTVAVVDMAGGL